LERLEDSLPPVLEEPLEFAIMAVDPDGGREDCGIRIDAQQVPKAFKKGRW
jgi:hypothetical protein